MDPGDRDLLTAGFKKVLDNHGHSFHQRVLREAEDLVERGSRWALEASEIPVAVSDRDTRIDFVLSRRGHDVRRIDSFLVAECKRPTQAFADWCFAQAAYVRRNERHGAVVADRVSQTEACISTRAAHLDTSQEGVFHLAFELKGGTAKECAHAPGRGAIEEAAGQVLLGQNGLIELLGSSRTFIPREADVIVIPVIFTTARIWVTHADLRQADLHTGLLGDVPLNIEPRPWIWYRYHMSPGLKHRRLTFVGAKNLGEWVEFAYARTVAVVSPTGIADFLLKEHW